MEELFKFEGVKMNDMVLTQDQVDQRKMFFKIDKNGFKHSRKKVDDIEEIKKLISMLKIDESMDIISDKFDSPNIINTFVGNILELYVATWAITPAGIEALMMATQDNIICKVMLDRTHSRKWLFASDAYSVLQGKVRFKFRANHSKFILLKLKDGSYYNFVGSMNLSNNPRFENIRITRTEQDYLFYSTFINECAGEWA